MKFCQKCGTQAEDSAAFCQKCGTPFNTAGEQAQNGAQQGQQYQQPVYQQPYAAQPNNTDKVLSVLSYISFLWIIGLVITPYKNDPKVRFHVGQGIILFIATAVLFIVAGILTGIFGIVTVFSFSAVSAILSFISALITLAVAVFYVVLAIIGIVNAVNGNQKPLPIIGKMAFYK